MERVEALMSRIGEAKRGREQAKEDTERLWQALLSEVSARPGGELRADWRWVLVGGACQYDRRMGQPGRLREITFYVYSIRAYGTEKRPERVDGSRIRSREVAIESGVCLFSKLNQCMPRARGGAEVPQDGEPMTSTEVVLCLDPDRPSRNLADLLVLLDDSDPP